MRILNLYAGIGGNRRDWGPEHDVLAVEYAPDIAAVYQALNPQDAVHVGDAHEFLRQHWLEFDFIWASPVCKSHSKVRGTMNPNTEALYPDMKLYEEILFLKKYARDDQRWVVENVEPWYTPLIPPQKVNRHLYWANFEITPVHEPPENLKFATVAELEVLHGISLEPFQITRKREILRNVASPKVGASILNDALRSLVQ